MVVVFHMCTMLVIVWHGSGVIESRGVARSVPGGDGGGGVRARYCC